MNVVNAKDVLSMLKNQKVDPTFDVHVMQTKVVPAFLDQNSLTIRIGDRDFAHWSSDFYAVRRQLELRGFHVSIKYVKNFYDWATFVISIPPCEE